MTIRKPTRPLNLDYWQLTSQIQQTLAETGGAAPQSPTTQQPITITTTNVKTGDVRKQTIPAGTSIESIKREAQKRLAAQEDERIDVEVDGKELKPTGITIPMTQAEIDAVAEHNANVSCQRDIQRINIYKVSGYDKEHNWTSVIVQETNKKDARQKAITTGLNVKQVTRQIGATPAIKPSEPTINQIEIKDGKTGDTLLFDKETWNALSSEYKDIVKSDGYEAMQDKFQSDHVQLGDNQWMAKDDFKALQEYDDKYGTTYTTIAQSEGFKALQAALSTETEARESAIAKLDKFKTIDGYNLLAARSGGVTPNEMILVGFEDKDVEAVDDAYRTSIRTGVALPGEVTWMNVKTNKKYTDAEYKKLLEDFEEKQDKLIMAGKYGSDEWDKLGEHPSNYHVLAPESARRSIIEMGSMFVFSPARALLPEVQLKDISKLEWAVGGAQLATLAMPAIPKGALPFVSAGAAGIFGYSTVKNWDKLSTPEKVLGSLVTGLVAIPAISAASKLSSSKLALAKANVKNAFLKTLGGKKLSLGPRSSKLDIATSKLQSLANEVKGTPIEKKVQPVINELTDALFAGDVRSVNKAGIKLSDLFATKKVRGIPKESTVGQLIRDGGSYVRANADDLVRSVEYRVIVQDILESPTWREARVKLSDFLDILKGEKIGRVQTPSKTLSQYLSENLYRSPGTTKGAGQVGPRPAESYLTMSWEEVTRLQKVQDKLQKLTESIPWKDRLYRDLQSRIPEVRQAALNDMWVYLEERYGAKYLQKYLQVDDLAKFKGIETTAKTAASQEIDDVLAEVKRILKDNKNRPPEAAPPSELNKLKPPEAPKGGTRVAVKEKIQVRPKTGQLTEAEKAALAKAKTKYGLKQLTKTELKALKAAKKKIELAKERAKRATEAIKKVEAERITQAQKILIAQEQLEALGIPLAATALPKGVKPEVIIQTSVRQATEVKPKVGIKPQVKATPQIKTRPEVQTQPRVATKPKVTPQARIATRTQVQPLPKVEPTPKPATKVQPTPQPVTKVTPEPFTPIPKKIKVATPFPRYRVVTEKTERRKLLEGPALATHKQGFIWVSWYPGHGKLDPLRIVYSRKRPLGARTAKGLRSPQRSFKGIGKLPTLMELPMGVVIARAKHGRTLTFSRRNGNRRRGRIIE